MSKQNNLQKLSVNRNLQHQLLQGHVYQGVQYGKGEKSDLPAEEIQKKEIVIVINDDQSESLSTDSEQLLEKILKAVKVEWSQVHIINIAYQEKWTFKELISITNVSKVILFGVSLSDMGVNINSPMYELIHFYDVKIIKSKSLKALKDHKADKRKLWQSLQKMFSVS